MKAWDELTKEQKLAAVESIASPGWTWPMRAESAWKFFYKLSTKVESKEPEHTAPDGTTRKDHYGMGRQPWDDILDTGWGVHFAAGNAFKYVRRHAAKNGEDDLEKGRWYAARLHEIVHLGHTGARLALSDLKTLCTQEEWDLLFPEFKK